MDTKKLLKNVPIGRTQYEFDNFVVGASNSAARQVRDLLVEKEELERQVSEFGVEAAGSRYADDVNKRLAQIDSFLGQFDEEQLANVLDNLEAEEGDHWAETLGRAAAIEVLTTDKISQETLTKMALLPIEDYTKSVEVSNRIIQYIKQTTSQIERDMFDEEPAELVTGADIRG